MKIPGPELLKTMSKPTKDGAPMKEELTVGEAWLIGLSPLPAPAERHVELEVDESTQAARNPRPRLSKRLRVAMEALGVKAKRNPGSPVRQYVFRKASQKERAAQDSCQREDRVIHARAEQEIREVRQQERQDRARLAQRCNAELREIARYEKGKDTVPPAKRLKVAKRRKRRTYADEVFRPRQRHYTGHLSFLHGDGPLEAPSRPRRNPYGIDGAKLPEITVGGKRLTEIGDVDEITYRTSSGQDYTHSIGDYGLPFLRGKGPHPKLVADESGKIGIYTGPSKTRFRSGVGILG